MNQDFLLLLIVAAVWAVLAVLYATVPTFHMPGYAAVWGWGAAIFLALAVLIAIAARGHAKQRKAPAHHDHE